MDKTFFTMVHILDGNSEMGVRVRNNLYYLICLRHLITSRAVTNRNFSSPKRPIILHGCATCFELPTNISTMHYVSLGVSGCSFSMFVVDMIEREGESGTEKERKREVCILTCWTYYRKGIFTERVCSGTRLRSV